MLIYKALTFNIINSRHHSWNPFNTQFIRWKYISRNLKWSTEGWWTSLLVFPRCLNEANIAWDADEWRMLTQNMDFCDFWIFGLGMRKTEDEFSILHLCNPNILAVIFLQLDCTGEPKQCVQISEAACRIWHPDFKTFLSNLLSSTMFVCYVVIEITKMNNLGYSH